ncbi:MAG: ribulokinase [Clostridiales bacterium]|nr:ribulokinase [Clostridiales bacterium]
MNTEKFVIGIDLGSLSGRIIIASVNDGRIVANHSKDYKHGIMTDTFIDGSRLGRDYNLTVPKDYLDVIGELIPKAIKSAGIHKKDIIGIGVDATSYTMITTDKIGKPLCEYEEFKYRPQAYGKLWKHLGALEDSKLFTKLAIETNQPFMWRFGNSISGEWMAPKVMETFRKDREVFDRATYFTDLSDWIVWMLTGNRIQNSGTAANKALWNEKDGYPSFDFLDVIDPALRQKMLASLESPIMPYGERAGYLKKQMADSLGLCENTPVAVGIIDAYAAFPPLGLGKPKEALMVLGTSAAVCLLNDEPTKVEGMCGIAKNSMYPGLYGYDTGQNCVGDLIKWFLENMIPGEYEDAAKKQDMTIYDYLKEKALIRKPWLNDLVILDWWRGNRSILCNLDLSGAILGLRMNTLPEDIYTGIILGIACGTRTIIDEFEKHGKLEKIVASGGISSKNPFFMQMYANILNRPIMASQVSDTPALGAAIYAAVAAGKKNGGYQSLDEAKQYMQLKESNFITYYPEKEHEEDYERIYKKYSYYHDLVGRNPYIDDTL